MQALSAMNDLERALCEAISVATQRAFPDWLAQPPFQEGNWTDQKKEAKWSPALSLIPVKRETSYGVNIRAIQRLRFKDGPTEFYASYSAVQTKNRQVILLGIDVAMIVPYVLPRGVFMLDQSA